MGHRCLACREKWECRICRQLHLQTNFSERERSHKYQHREKPKCLECMSPSCSNPACKTCKSCRNVQCKDPATCTKEPEILVGAALEQMKKTKLCKACRKNHVPSHSNTFLFFSSDVLQVTFINVNAAKKKLIILLQNCQEEQFWNHF